MKSRHDAVLLAPLGDLVTMPFWDDISLNEAFATWITRKIIDRWQPEWRSGLDQLFGAFCDPGHVQRGVRRSRWTLYHRGRFWKGCRGNKADNGSGGRVGPLV